SGECRGASRRSSGRSGSRMVAFTERAEWIVTRPGHRSNALRRELRTSPRTNSLPPPRASAAWREARNSASSFIDQIPFFLSDVGDEARGLVVLAQGPEDGQPRHRDGPAALPHLLGQQGRLLHSGERLARDGFTHGAP